MPTLARIPHPGPPQDEVKAIPRAQQGAADTAAGRAAVVRWRKPWVVPQTDDQLRARILALLRRWPKWPDPPWRWWSLRQALGGGVRTADMRRLIDSLIADGEVIEVYEATGNRRQHRHLLILPEQWRLFEWGAVVEVVGRADVLERLGLRPLPGAGSWS